VLVAYTDGVTEALNPQGAEFAEERLRSIIEQSMHLTAEEITARVLANVHDWRSSAPQHDDITLIVGKVK
jgi:sigma-B regulation protein RsbU (phosphoserine phosphatase)